jgi:hypothetical protein
MAMFAHLGVFCTLKIIGYLLFGGSTTLAPKTFFQVCESSVFGVFQQSAILAQTDMILCIEKTEDPKKYF